MIVVADTSPLSYLVLIGEIDLLPALFGAVSVPPAVASELLYPSGPAQIVRWMSDAPDWLQVRDVGGKEATPRLAALDAGEREAILLASSTWMPTC